MDKKELLERFNSICTEIDHNNKEDMQITLDTFKEVFCSFAEVSPRAAKEILENYEGTLKFYNFLTEDEVVQIIQKLKLSGHSIKWDSASEFFNRAEFMGGKFECPPFYNKWALYMAINKIHALQFNVLKKWIGDSEEECFEACYDLAVSHLKDKGNPYWVRKIFDLPDK